MQAKDIKDEWLLRVIATLQQAPYVFRKGKGLDVHHPRVVMSWEIYNLWPSIPEKVIRAKLKNLMKKDYIDGCTCGCRGDFMLLDLGKLYLLERV